VTFKVRTKPQPPPVDTSLELVEDFGTKVRKAREKLGLSHEELGKKINEKVSLLRKIETGRMTPNDKLTATLEHVLKVKLITSAKEERAPESKMPKKSARELTLGDLIQLGKKGEEK
jgi:putative transcription factor